MTRQDDLRDIFFSYNNDISRLIRKVDGPMFDTIHTPVASHLCITVRDMFEITYEANAPLPVNGQ